MNQILISTLGCIAIFLVSRKDKWQRYGYIFGLLSQPFWFIETFRAEQWGIFILCIWYTINWSIGIYNYWVKR